MQFTAGESNSAFYRKKLERIYHNIPLCTKFSPFPYFGVFSFPCFAGLEKAKVKRFAERPLVSLFLLFSRNRNKTLCHKLYLRAVLIIPVSS